MNPTNDSSKWEYKCNTPYEITVNYSDNYQCLKVPDLRLINCGKQLQDILAKYPEIKYHFRCEVSMPQYGNITKQRYARVHHHGIVMFTTTQSLKTFLLTVWHQLTAIADVQLNEYRPDHWPEYMRKHKSIFGKEGMVASVPMAYFDKCEAPV